MQNGYELILGNALDELRKLPSASVQSCITSPPYWAIRDYDIPPTVWATGSELECKHEWEWHSKKSGMRGGTNNPLFGAFKGDTHIGETSYAFCKKCNAWNGALGLEPTLELFINNTVLLFEEVKRVLKDDGTLWLNIGDCYNSAKRVPGMDAKNLLGIPWRLALALQEHGWILRSDIIWHKPNPMPSGTADRPIVAHEYIFLFSKSPKYYYDADSIRVKQANTSFKGTPPNPDHQTKDEIIIDGMSMTKAGELREGAGSRPRGINDIMAKNGRFFNPKGRHPHSVWKVATKAFPGAHFATFPSDLITPCVKAGAPEGGIILDPFSGTATTGAVALENGRQYIGIELSEEYMKMGEDRLAAVERKLGLNSGAEWL